VEALSREYGSAFHDDWKRLPRCMEALSMMTGSGFHDMWKARVKRI